MTIESLLKFNSGSGIPVFKFAACRRMSLREKALQPVASDDQLTAIAYNQVLALKPRCLLVGNITSSVKGTTAPTVKPPIAHHHSVVKADSSTAVIKQITAVEACQGAARL